MFKKLLISRGSLGLGIMLTILGVHMNSTPMMIIGIIIFAIGIESCLSQLEDEIKEWVKKNFNQKNSDTTSE